MKMKKIRPESKLFPKFIPETSLGGSPENFRITLTAKPGVNEKYSLNLSNNCPAILDQLNGKILPCERINQVFSLGYVSDKGVCMDLNEISDQYNSYYDKIRSQCKVCYSAETCTQCFLQIDYFPTSRTCQAFTNKAAFAEILKRRISLLEKRPTLFHEILNDVILK